MSRHAMPAADAAWLHMDRPTNPMVVNAVVALGAPLDAGHAADVLEQRLVDRFPRFSQRVSDQLGRAPAFEDDPDFDLANHVHHLALPAPGDRAALQDLAGDLIGAPLDPGRPLWHAYLIDGYGEGAAVLWRIHHCVADGIALARVLLSLTDGAAVDVGVGGGRGDRGPLGVPGRALGTVGRLAGAALHEGSETLAHPRHLGELAGAALRDAATLAKLLAAPADADTDLSAPLAGRRKVAWSDPFPLARVKEAAHARGATVNDVLVSTLTGALRERLGVDGPVPDEIHALVPFNLRPLDEPVDPRLGNDFGLILLALPLGIADPERRLREVRRRMEEIKRSHEAPISYGILSAIGQTPPPVEDLLIGFFSDKASLVVTNVPGPRDPVSFAGAPVTGVLVWAPCSGNMGATVSIFSYAGEVSVGFMSDVALVPDPQPIVSAYEAGLERLCVRAGADDGSAG
jgi:WS/DGAT/MGAT family acyltransferase